MLHVLHAAGFDIDARNHAPAILSADFPNEMSALIGALLSFRISARDIIRSGGGHAPSTMRLRDALNLAGWHKHTFVVQTIVDGVEREAISHEVDHVHRSEAGTLALEIEWNNKDPFFDRDLENFQRLHAQGAISAGILVTRGARLQAALAGIVETTVRMAGITEPNQLTEWGVKARSERQTADLSRRMERDTDFATAFAQSFVADKFGAATTHWAKLMDRIQRGVGNPCPLLLIGLPVEAVEGYSAANPEL